MPNDTPYRRYPYPLDSDPINVAIDIELLAEAIDIDMMTTLDAQATFNAEMLAQGGAGTAALQAQIDANNARDDVQDARLNGHTGDIAGVGAANAAQDARIETLTTQMAVQNGEDKAQAGIVALTLDGLGWGVIAFPAGTFRQDTGCVVYADVIDSSGSPDSWIESNIHTAAWNGFSVQCAIRNTNNVLSNWGIIVNYIAVARRP